MNHGDERMDLVWLCAGFLVAFFISLAGVLIAYLVGWFSCAYAFGGMASTWLIAARLVYGHIR